MIKIQMPYIEPWAAQKPKATYIREDKRKFKLSTIKQQQHDLDKERL